MAYAQAKIFEQRTPQTGKSARTARKLQEAFKSRLASAPFESITLSALAEECGVARSTVYRKWAGVGDLLWSLVLPCAQAFMRDALAGNSASAVSRLSRFWTMPGMVPAMTNPGVAPLMVKNLTTIAAAEIERRSGRRNAETPGLLIAGALLTFLRQHALREPPDDDQKELVFIVYTSGFMTPQSFRAIVRDQARSAAEGTFPPAVSLRESLASDDHIISMIDGRPYRSLRRHLARFGMTPDDYRRCFNLPDDYPMVARSYSEERRLLAQAQFGRQSVGFGSETGAAG